MRNHKRNHKPLRRILAAALTIVMALALTVPAFALEAGDTCPPGCETCAKFLAEHGYKSQTDAVPTVTSFSDVPSNHTFYDAIMYCASQGIVSGYSDGTFKPANTVTNSNFTVMLSRAFYADEVASYVAQGYQINGTFYPNYIAMQMAGALRYTSFETSLQNVGTMNKGITRYDMAQLMTNIMGNKGFAATESQKSAVINEIKDYSEIPSQYRDAVTNVYALGIIGGFSNGTFGGTGIMTRGQACIVIYRMLQKANGSITNPGTDPEAPVDPDTGAQSCLCKSIYGYCPCVGEKAPDSGNNGNTGSNTGNTGNTGTTTPETPSTPVTPTGRTLSNGKAITEANITEILNQLKVTYPSTTSFGEGYYGLGSGRTPSSNCIAQIVSTYTGTRGDKCSTAMGCGGWAAFVADEIFGQRSSTWNWKKTTLTDIRPGDMMIQLDNNGYLMHVSICTGLVEGQSPTVRVYSTDATCLTGAAADYKIGWNRCVTAGSNYDIYTAYPD